MKKVRVKKHLHAVYFTDIDKEKKLSIICTYVSNSQIVYYDIDITHHQAIIHVTDDDWRRIMDIFEREGLDNKQP